MTTEVPGLRPFSRRIHTLADLRPPENQYAIAKQELKRAKAYWEEAKAYLKTSEAVRLDAEAIRKEASERFEESQKLIQKADEAIRRMEALKAEANRSNLNKADQKSTQQKAIPHRNIYLLASAIALAIGLLMLSAEIQLMFTAAAKTAELVVTLFASMPRQLRVLTASASIGLATYFFLVVVLRHNPS
jgi:hypothetical protein